MSQDIPVITQQRVAKLLPKRPQNSHKGLLGVVTVIGGNTGMTGAALLAARAALKLGAGCVHVTLLTEDAPCVDLMQAELMLHSAHTDLIDSGVLVAGCGMGQNLMARQWLSRALQSQSALILDADALNLLATHCDMRDQLIVRQAPAILTPHPGEAARLLGCSTADIQADRIASVQKLQRMFDCSVVLKGAGSLCATRDGCLHENHTGNCGMSAPGMGDVLTGMIAAFIAQGLSADDAMLLAVHLHGAAGDAMATQGITIGMTATELTDRARLLLNQWISD